MASLGMAHCAIQTHYLLKVFVWDETAHRSRQAMQWPTMRHRHQLSRIDRFSLGPIEEGSKRGRDGSRGAGVLARGTRSCT